MGRALAAGVVIGWWALCTAQYLPVWNTPVALATHAMTHAPANNYGLSWVYNFHTDEPGTANYPKG